jgi:hypothetical protein
MRAKAIGQLGACFENRRCSGRAKARPHYMLPSEISSGHGLQPVRFFMRLGARIAHEIVSPNFDMQAIIEKPPGPPWTMEARRHRSLKQSDCFNLLEGQRRLGNV